MDTVYWWTGAAVWWIAAGWLSFEVFIVGLANAFSRIRWHLADMSRNKRKPRWRKFPSYVLGIWIELIGYRNRGAYSVTTDSGSEWRGIGDWTLRTKAYAIRTENEPCEEDEL